MGQTIAEAIYAEGMLEGKAEGMLKGKLEGRAEGALASYRKNTAAAAG